MAQWLIFLLILQVMGLDTDAEICDPGGILSATCRGNTSNYASFRCFYVFPGLLFAPPLTVDIMLLIVAM